MKLTHVTCFYRSMGLSDGHSVRGSVHLREVQGPYRNLEFNTRQLKYCSSKEGR